MPRTRPFRPMDTAPLDGTVVEIRHGPDQVTVRAWWNGRLQGWIQDGDETRMVLHRVTGWRVREWVEKR